MINPRQRTPITVFPACLIPLANWARRILNTALAMLCSTAEQMDRWYTLRSTEITFFSSNFSLFLFLSLAITAQ